MGTQPGKTYVLLLCWREGPPAVIFLIQPMNNVLPNTSILPQRFPQTLGTKNPIPGVFALEEKEMNFKEALFELFEIPEYEVVMRLEGMYESGAFG